MIGISGKYLEIEPGVEIYYEDCGSGQPMLLVPGWTMTTEVFEKQAAFFSKKYRVITMDPRSHGRSSKTTQGNSYYTHGQDLAKLIDALDLKDLILLGWSAGNVTVWHYVQAFGTEKLKALVTVDMSPKALSHDPLDWTEGSLEEVSEVYTKWLDTPKGQREFFNAAETVMFTGPRNAEACSWVVDQSLKTPHYAARALYGDAMFSNVLEGAKAADSALPCMTFIAEHWADIAVPFMNKHCPNSKTFVIGGHFAFWEYHEKFNAALAEFLDGIKD